MLHLRRSAIIQRIQYYRSDCYLTTWSKHSKGHWFCLEPNHVPRRSKHPKHAVEVGLAKKLETKTVPADVIDNAILNLPRTKSKLHVSKSKYEW